jgi:hypothetical protein
MPSVKWQARGGSKLLEAPTTCTKAITIAKRGRRIYLNCACKAMEFLYVAAK